MLAEIDLLIRGGVIGITALTFSLLWLNPASRAKSYSVGAIAIALAGHLAETQGISGAWSERARETAAIIGHFIPVAMTWFVLDIFLEREDRDSRLVRGLAALALLVWIICLSPASFSPVHIALSILLDLGLIYVVVVTGPDDLIERRRSFRLVFVSAMMVFGISKLLLDALLTPEARPLWFDTGYAAAVLGFTLVFAHWALRPGRDIWTEQSVRDTGNTAETDRVNAHILGQITHAMRNEIWRREGLTIGQMAQELNIPEHRLRQAINRDLGYRNFPAFVNGYRIDAAKAALSAPENAQKTILEIAYDVGFASLGPFNKAFRAMTGTSPRDYRRSAMDDPSILA